MTVENAVERIKKPGKKSGKKPDNKDARPDPLRRLISNAGPERAPDFFCVGGDVTSLAVLWRMLSSHPDICLPIAPNARHTGKAGDARVGDMAALAALLTEPTALDLAAAQAITTELRLAVGTDKAYLRIFGGLAEAAVGEVSAHHSMFGVAGVRRMQRLAPQAKVILLLDDPVERVVAAATAAAAAAEPEATESMVAERARRMAKSEHTLSRGIENHRVAYGDQLYIAFRSDLFNRPAQLFKSLASILGVDPKAAELPRQEDYSDHRVDVPAAVRGELYEMLAEEYRALGERYPDVVSQWRSRQESLISA